MKCAVVSGKGGSGKSSVTAALVSLSKSVIAVDCDVDASNLPLLFHHQIFLSESFSSGSRLHVDPLICVGCGHCISLCNYHALTLENGKIKVNQLFCEGCGWCLRQCPVGAITLESVADSHIYSSSFDNGMMVHGELHPGDDNSGKMVTRIREIADRLMEEHQVSLQILDGPPGIGCPVLSTLTGVDKILIVCEPTLSGISDLMRIQTIASNFSDDIQVLINKSDINPSNTEKIEQLCASSNMKVVGRLPFDRKMVEAQVHGQSIVDYAPTSVCTQVLSRLHEQLFR